MKKLSLLIILEAMISFMVLACAETPTPDIATEGQAVVTAAQTTRLTHTVTPPPTTGVDSTGSVTLTAPPATTLSETPQTECLQRVTSSATPTAGEPVALRSDIQIRKVITTSGEFVRLALDPISNDLYYMDTSANIYRLDLQPGTASTSMQIYSLADIGGAPYTLGMTFGPDGVLYVVGNDTQPYTTQAIIRKGILNESGARVWSTLASTDPYPTSNTFFDHRFSAIVASPDGDYVYVSSGSRTDHGETQANQDFFPGVREVPLTSAIFRIPADVTELLLARDEANLAEYLFADGIRNTFDLAFGPNGELFGTENGPDADYPEELNWIRQGHHYGFPWRLGAQDNPQQFTDYDPAQDPLIIKDAIANLLGAYHNDPDFPSLPVHAFTDPILNLGPDGDHFRDMAGCEQKASALGQPLHTFTPHRVPLGLTFDTEGHLSEEFKGDAFVLSYGPAYDSLTDRGQDLLHLELTKIGETYQMQATQLVRDFNFPVDSVLVGHKLYVLEYGSQELEEAAFGTIWEVTLP